MFAKVARNHYPVGEEFTHTPLLHAYMSSRGPATTLMRIKIGIERNGRKCTHENKIKEQKRTVCLSIIRLEIRRVNLSPTGGEVVEGVERTCLPLSAASLCSQLQDPFKFPSTVRACAALSARRRVHICCTYAERLL